MLLQTNPLLTFDCPINLQISNNIKKEGIASFACYHPNPQEDGGCINNSSWSITTSSHLKIETHNAPTKDPKDRWSPQHLPSPPKMPILYRMPAPRVPRLEEKKATDNLEKNGITRMKAQRRKRQHAVCLTTPVIWSQNVSRSNKNTKSSKAQSHECKKWTQTFQPGDNCHMGLYILQQQASPTKMDHVQRALCKPYPRSARTSMKQYHSLGELTW